MTNEEKKPVTPDNESEVKTAENKKTESKEAVQGTSEKPEKIETEAKVHIDKVDDGFEITRILLVTRGQVPDIEKDKFLELANNAKIGCPVSKALKATTIDLDADLI